MIVLLLFLIVFDCLMEFPECRSHLFQMVCPPHICVALPKHRFVLHCVRAVSLQWRLKRFAGGLRLRRSSQEDGGVPLAVDGAAAAAPVDPLAPLAVPLAVHAGAAAAPEDHVAPVPAPLAVGDGVAAAPVDPVAHSFDVVLLARYPKRLFFCIGVCLLP